MTGSDANGEDLRHRYGRSAIGCPASTTVARPGARHVWADIVNHWGAITTALTTGGSIAGPAAANGTAACRP